MDDRTREKKQRLLDALDKGIGQIHLDARRPGVSVPTQFRDNALLVLNISFRFDPPDLTVTDWGVRQTLSFSGSRFSVSVPWSAIFGVVNLTSKEMAMFTDDMPPEVAEGTTDKVPDKPTVPLAPPPPHRPRAIVREVVLDRGADAPEATPAKPRAARALRSEKLEPAEKHGPAEKAVAPVSAESLESTTTPPSGGEPTTSGTASSEPRDAPAAPASKRGHLRLVK